MPGPAPGINVFATVDDMLGRNECGRDGNVR
jgi:hypothetical protein